MAPTYTPAPGSGLIHAKLQVYIYQPPHNTLGTKGRAKGKVLRRRGYRYDPSLSKLFNGGIQVRDIGELRRMLKRVAEALNTEMEEYDGGEK